MLVLKDILALALALEGTRIGEREIIYVIKCLCSMVVYCLFINILMKNIHFHNDLLQLV